MNILLDTHIAIWAISNHRNLPEKARELISDPDNNIFFSSVSAWEVLLKHDNPKNNLILTPEEFVGYCEESGYYQLNMKSKHVLEAAALLATIRFPPAGTRFIERLDRTERKPPFRFEMKSDLGKIIRKIVEVVFFQVVGTVATARDAATLGHPPRRRIAERLEDWVLDNLIESKRHSTLSRVGGPVKISFFRRLVTGNLAAAIPLRKVIVTWLVSAANVVTEYIVAKARIRVGKRPQELVAIGFVPGPDEFGPPAKACSPAFE